MLTVRHDDNDDDDNQLNVCLIPTPNTKQISIKFGLMSRVFANGPVNRGFNPRSSHTKDSKNGT